MEPEGQKNPLVPVDPTFYKNLLDQMTDGVYFVDLERRILYWNEGARRLTGYMAEEVLGRDCQDDILCHIDSSGKRLSKEGSPLTASMADGAPREASVFLRHKMGRRIPVHVRIHTLRDADGAIIGAVEIFSDDSAQNEVRRKAELMVRMAFYDHLTQLANRRFMEMSVRMALEEFQMHKFPFGVLVIDLDEFKTINDTFGHSSGDRALQEVAKTLVGTLRPTDTVGRWGGDEFLAIVRNVDGRGVHSLAERCVAVVKQITVVGSDDRRFPASISVGAALARAEDTAEELIHRADVLMYESKAGGRGRATVEPGTVKTEVEGLIQPGRKSRRSSDAI